MTVRLHSRRVRANAGMLRSRLRLLSSAGLVLSLAGCASKGYVAEQVRQRERAVMAELTALRARTGESRLQIQLLAEADAQISESVPPASAVVRDASSEADRATGLATGTFSGEIRLVDDSVRFSEGSSELTREAAGLLDAFATQLLVRNEDVVVEVHGHTDSTGDNARNQLLGVARAESVRRYLSQRHGIPAARLATTSSGPSAPIADNVSPEGRARNRRVTLVVRCR